MTDPDVNPEDPLIHFLKNQLAIIVGFADLMLEEFEGSDRRRSDVLEIRRAAQAMIARVPDITRRLGSGAQ